MATAARFGKAQTFGRAQGSSPPVAARAPAARARASQDAEPVTAAPMADAAQGWHVGFLSLGLMAVLIVIYVYEMRLSGSIGSAVNGNYFIAFGGVSWKYLVQQHEWWRFFTASWLHADFGHITGNGVVLVITGWRLERLIGRAWLLAAYVVGAIGGSIGSLAFTSAAVTVSLGASGAIMALVALLFVMSFHASADEKAAKRYRRYALVMLIPALLPSVGSDGGAIDVGAHFGGAVAGTAFGFLLLTIWPEDGSKPPFAWAAAGSGVIGLGITAVAFLAAWQHLPGYAAEARQLAPPAIVEDYDKSNRTAELVKAYPHDPLAHLVRAVHLYGVRDMNGALGEIRAGLDEKHALATYFSPDLMFHLRLMLVLGLMAEERPDDARSEAQSICPVIRDPDRWPVHGSRAGKLASAIAFARDNHLCD